MKLTDLPHFERFRESRDVKVLRHRSRNENLWDLHGRAEFQAYQDGQSWDVFGSAKYLLSFIAERHKYAKFAGVWEVKGKRKASNGYRYQTVPIQGYEELCGRLIVKWGEGTRSWAQWLHRRGDKEIVEILPPNYVMDFPGYYNFFISYDQLRTMVKNPDSNREWQRMLSSAGGVYLILDQNSGRQYVGSAYGKGGFWARWKSYARNPSGGNALLKILLGDHPGRERRFQFSILRVLEPGSTKDDVVAQEVLIKRKLGSRAFGLDGN